MTSHDTDWVLVPREPTDAEIDCLTTIIRRSAWGRDNVIRQFHELRAAAPPPPSRDAHVAKLEEALRETISVLKFAIEDGYLSDEDIMGLCIDPYGVLADARSDLGGEKP